MIRRPLGWLAVVSVWAASALGCVGTRTVHTPVFRENQVEVTLRHTLSGGEPVAMQFEHPRTISAIRMRRILASLDVRERKEERERVAAVSSEILSSLAAGVAEALERADSNQEVVVMATETKRRFGVLTSDHLTSMVIWSKDDRLWIYLGDVDSALSSDPTEKPKKPVRGKAGGKFRVVKTVAIDPVGPQTVAIDWRDERFSKALDPRTRSGSRKLRRTILMEERGAADREE